MLIAKGILPFALCFRRPRRDSNAQPTDSKSGTLSIELRGRALRDIIALLSAGRKGYTPGRGSFIFPDCLHLTFFGHRVRVKS